MFSLLSACLYEIQKEYFPERFEKVFVWILFKTQKIQNKFLSYTKCELIIYRILHQLLLAIRRWCRLLFKSLHNLIVHSNIQACIGLVNFMLHWVFMLFYSEFMCLQAFIYFHRLCILKRCYFYVIQNRKLKIEAIFLINVNFVDFSCQFLQILIYNSC